MPIQAPQWTEFLSCPICCNMFNENCHRPISLGCGHTVCKNCLGKLQHKKCPFDSNVISRDLDELPINFALLQLVGVAVPDTENDPNGTNLAENIQFYKASKRCIEELAIFLKPVSTGLAGATTTLLSRPMQRKLVTLVNCQLIEEEGRARAMRSARSLGERTVTEFILAHQNPTQLSANLWAAVRARGCQFLGPAMQEEVLKLILLALEDGSALSRKVLVLFVVQRLETQYPQASKTAIGHVVQLLYRASCFKVTKREEESSLMQLKEEFRTYEMLRREHDSQIVQIATEAGLRIAPDQWSSLLYGDSAHKSHMQSIIDKLQTPQSMTQSITELMMALQRTGDPASLARLQPHFDLLANIDPSPDVPPPLWENLQAVMKAVKTVVQSFASFISSSHHSKVETSSVQNNKYKTSMCRDLMQRNKCPRGPNCTFAHSEEEMERYRNKTKKLGSGIPNVGKVNPIQSMSSMQTTPSVLMTMQDQELDFALRQEMRTPTPDIYCSTFDDLSSESDMRRFPLSCSVTSLPMAQASQMSLYTSPISLPRDRTNKALLCKPRVSSFEIPTNPSEHEHEANLYGISQYQQVVQATGVPETHGTVYREASPSVLYDLSAPAAVYYEPVQHAPRYVKMVKPIPNPIYVSAEERQLKRATALPPNPYTMKRCQVEPREAAAYPDGLSYSKLPMQTLGELHHRRDELLAQLNKTASSPPSVNQAPHLVDKERSPPSSMPLKIVKSVADSVAITHVTASLAKQKDDVKPTVYHEQLKNADHIGAYIAWTSSAMAVNHPSPSPSPPPPPSTQSQTTHNREHPTNGELNEDQIPVCAPYEELEIPIEMPIVEEEVFVCNSEETNDEFVPFSHTVVSKYGPISRMAKARVKQAAPVQVTAAQGKTVTPVTAVTPTSRPFPITSPVPSRFFPVNDYHTVREDHTHKPSPQGVNVAASLPSAHLKTLLTAGSGASSNMEPYQLWAVNKERANSPSVKPVSEREQIRHELARLGQQIQNLQMSEDGRLARELQSVELSIRETERKMQITERSSTSISSQEENRNATIAIQLQAEQELEIQQRTQERFRVETTAEKAAREKLLQERRDRQLAEQLVVDEARQKGIHLMPGQVVGMSVNPNQHGY